MADIQLDQGYTKIAHKILEATMKLKLSPTQFKIIMAVWRYTYGFNRKDHEMSLTFLADAIGAHKQGVKKDLDKLIEMRIIVVTQESTFSTSRRIAFNKNYDTWIDLQSVKQRTVSQIADSTVSQIAYQEINIKDIYKENIKESISSSSEENQFSEIINFYTQNLQRGVSETPNNLELINQWFGEFGFDLLLAAMKVAAKAEAKGVNYTEGVLMKWKEAGVKTIEDARKFELEFKQKRKGYRKRPIRTEVLPDWFDKEQIHRLNITNKETEADAVAKKQELEEILSEFRSK